MEPMLPNPGQPAIDPVRPVMSFVVCNQHCAGLLTLRSASAKSRRKALERSKGRLMRCNIAGLRIVFATLVALVASAPVKPDETALAAGTANDGPGGGASWTTGNKLAVGTSVEKTSQTYLKFPDQTAWFSLSVG
jgi:hypothetical protein